jgi:hypothetical protein
MEKLGVKSYICVNSGHISLAPVFGEGKSCIGVWEWGVGGGMKNSAFGFCFQTWDCECFTSVSQLTALLASSAVLGSGKPGV